MNWTSEIARQHYEKLSKDRDDLAVAMGLMSPQSEPQTATEIAESRRIRSLRTPQDIARASADYNRAVEPILASMRHLVAKYTTPDRILIDADTFEIVRPKQKEGGRRLVADED